MDKLLRPERFDTEASVANAEKLYRHWKLTFQNFVKMTLPAPATPDPNDANAVAAAAVTSNNNNQKKLQALFNSVSATIFELISDCVDYDQAFQVLDTAYMKPVSVIYNRHKLIACKQEPTQSIDT